VQFQRLTGVSEDQFSQMCGRLRDRWRRGVLTAKKKSGRPWDIADRDSEGLEDHLLLLLILCIAAM